jgi:hypothetical protein
MNTALVVTVLGPLTASFGWFLQSSLVYWLGVILCAITLLLNMAVGGMKLPILPIIFMTFSVNYFRDSWYFGAAIGLVAWTTVDAIGEIIGHMRNR